MWQTMQSFIEEKNAVFGVSVTHVESGEHFSARGDDPFQQASVFKVPILLSLLKKVDRGEIDLTARVTLTQEDEVYGSGILKELSPGLAPTFKDLAVLMIIVSDNLATDKILKIIGLETVQKDLKDWGFTRTTMDVTTSDLLAHSVGLTPKPYSQSYATELHKRLSSEQFDPNNRVFQTHTETNTTTPNEMNQIYERLLAEELLSPSSTSIALDILRRQHLNRRIPRYLPKSVQVLHKTGSLADHLNDAGIIRIDDHNTLIISIFSRGHASTEAGEDDIAHIANRAVQIILNRSSDTIV
ncbi:serine hydrolase [Geomicrobium sp. JSM 1781026]|uniref:serine hydrolase n=1 Tax=Geomicrobium sp. JSM 1781026 TaxID=3344580 RepID=UPI0035C19EBB